MVETRRLTTYSIALRSVDNLETMGIKMLASGNSLIDCENVTISITRYGPVSRHKKPYLGGSAAGFFTYYRVILRIFDSARQHRLVEL